MAAATTMPPLASTRNASRSDATRSASDGRWESGPKARLAQDLLRSFELQARRARPEARLFREPGVIRLNFGGRCGGVIPGFHATVEATVLSGVCGRRI